MGAEAFLAAFDMPGQPAVLTGLQACWTGRAAVVWPLSSAAWYTGVQMAFHRIITSTFCIAGQMLIELLFNSCMGLVPGATPAHCVKLQTPGLRKPFGLVQPFSNPVYHCFGLRVSTSGPC